MDETDKVVFLAIAAASFILALFIHAGETSQ